MEDKLVTLAILTYAKAQILKNVLENEGIEAYIHNVNLIQPVISSGVRLRIKESDLPHALQIIESSAWLSEDIIKGKESSSEKNKEKRKDVYKRQVPGFGMAGAYPAGGRNAYFGTEESAFQKCQTI